MFKKVIGQDASEPQKPSLTTPEERAPQVPAPPTGYSSAPPAAGKPSAGSTRNVLSSDVEIKGTVKFEHDLIVDGKIEGDIQSTGNLTVGENARIKAEIKTGTIVVYGKVHGNMTAERAPCSGNAMTRAIITAGTHRAAGITQVVRGGGGTAVSHAGIRIGEREVGIEQGRILAAEKRRAKRAFCQEGFVPGENRRGAFHRQGSADPVATRADG